MKNIRDMPREGTGDNGKGGRGSVNAITEWKGVPESAGVIQHIPNILLRLRVKFGAGTRRLIQAMGVKSAFDR